MYKPFGGMFFSCMFVTCEALLVFRVVSVSAWSQRLVDSKGIAEEDSRATKQDADAPSSMCRCTPHAHSPRVELACSLLLPFVLTSG